MRVLAIGRPMGSRPGIRLTAAAADPGGDVHRGLGRAVEVVQPGTPETLRYRGGRRTAGPARGQRLAAADDIAQACGTPRPGLLQEEQQHGGDEVQHA